MLQILDQRTKEEMLYFSGALSTIYYSEIGNMLPSPHELLFSLDSKESFICTIQDRIMHTTTFGTPVVGQWLKQKTPNDNSTEV